MIFLYIYRNETILLIVKKGLPRPSGVRKIFVLESAEKFVILDIMPGYDKLCNFVILSARADTENFVQTNTAMR